MIGIDDVKVRLLSYGPKTTLKLDGEKFQVDPDILIALEGIGTIKGVTLEDRLRELLLSGRDLRKFALKLHEESTRRGHASLTTSLSIQLEVIGCSRAASMLLVAPPFGSYIQESQRRRIISRDDFVIPRRILSDQEAEKIFEKAVEKSYEIYRFLIDSGVEIEDARYVLPLASATSLFASGSLDTFLGFIIDSRRLGRSSDTYPEELSLIGEEILKAALQAAPILTKAKLLFKTSLPTYPYANPYKEGDPIIDRIIREAGEPAEPKLLSFTCLIKDKDLILNALSDPAKASTLPPLLNAVFLEPLSLAAYHQSIRHRTVPTAVESIYKAFDRLIEKPEKSLTIPPRINSSESLSRRFMDAIQTMIGSYESLRELGALRSDAIYLAPQAMRIYAVRLYNAFNLLWPQGYVAMRTCSHSQWEERRIAYRIWSSIGERSPEIASIMGERCKLLGYCPEREWCEIILKYREYDEEAHRKALRKLGDELK
ncbi:MAG: FAD-dependent thymidylate synthase [Thaumarchaeota archaeon]|nr:FAD-dependent thymidylate synthase [Nitrososphaerota archaeon]